MTLAELIDASGTLKVVATYLLHSTLVFAAVWALHFRAGARLRDWLWKAAFILPLVSTGARSMSVAPPFAPAWQLPPVAALTPGAAGDAAPLRHIAAAPVESARQERSRAVAGERSLAVPSFEASRPVGSNLPMPSFKAIIAALAAVLVAIAFVLPGLRLRWFLRSARPIESGEWFEDLSRLLSSSGLVRPVSLYEHTGLKSPVAAGWLRRSIYLPPRVRELHASARRALLAHELAHHARADPLWNRLTHGLTLALFFQPLNRIARKRSIACAELLADDLAVRWTGDGEGLARCLTAVAAWGQSHLLTSTTLAMVRSKKPRALRERIQRALDAPHEKSAALSLPAAFALSAATWCLMPSLSAGSPPVPLAEEVKAGPAIDHPYTAALEEIEKELRSLTPRKANTANLETYRRELDLLHSAVQAAMEPEQGLECTSRKIKLRDELKEELLVKRGFAKSLDAQVGERRQALDALYTGRRERLKASLPELRLQIRDSEAQVRVHEGAIEQLKKQSPEERGDKLRLEEQRLASQKRWLAARRRLLSENTKAFVKECSMTHAESEARIAPELTDIGEAQRRVRERISSTKAQIASINESLNNHRCLSEIVSREVTRDQSAAFEPRWPSDRQSTAPGVVENNFMTARTLGAATGLPLLVSFTESGAADHRALESRVFSSSKVALLVDGFIRAELHTDAENPYVRHDIERRARELTQAQGQPVFVAMDPRSGEVLGRISGTGLGPEEFASFLSSAVERFGGSRVEATNQFVWRRLLILEEDLRRHIAFGAETP